MNKAMELSVNTIAKDNEICRVSDLIIGETAAIALPPQMAVPTEIR